MPYGWTSEEECVDIVLRQANVNQHGVAAIDGCETHGEHCVDFSSFVHGCEFCLCLSRCDSVLHPERLEHGLELVLERVQVRSSNVRVPLPFRFLEAIKDEAGKNAVLEEFERAVEEDAEVCVRSQIHLQASLGINLPDDGPRVTVSSVKRGEETRRRSSDPGLLTRAIEGHRFPPAVL